MKTALSVVPLILATLAVAQDADSKHYKVLFENDRMRVLIVTFEKGDGSTMRDHVITLSVALTDRTERITGSDTPPRVATAPAGDIRVLGGAYQEENVGEQPFQSLLVEFKTQATQAAAISALQEMGRSRRIANEASAIAYLGTLNLAERTFSATYHKGFTDGLNRMAAPTSGPPSEDRADLIQPWLAGLTGNGSDRVISRNGYRITYTPGDGVFGTISTYTIVARPIEYGDTGERSFFTDHTGIIRATSENRPSEAADPPVERNPVKQHP